MTILGYVQRGGTPSFGDRLLATSLGTACVDLIANGAAGIMVASRGTTVQPVPLASVAGRLKLVPMDHHWVLSARSVSTCLGD